MVEHHKYFEELLPDLHWQFANHLTILQNNKNN